jgi:hypothetical protein
MNVISPAEWYEKAAVAIVRNNYSLFRWANENDKGLTQRDCENITRTKAWQDVMRAERNKFFKELANDPSRSRNVAVGQLLFAVQRLLEAEQFDKAVAALAQLFKVEGWANDQTSVNIFNDLSAKNLDDLRKKLGKQPKELVN